MTLGDLMKSNNTLDVNVKAINEQIAAARRVTGLVGNPVGPVISTEPLKKLAEKAKLGEADSPSSIVGRFKAIAAPLALKRKIDKMVKYQKRFFKPEGYGSKTDGPFTIASVMMIVLGSEGWHEKIREHLGAGWFELQTSVLYDPSIVGPLIMELRKQNELFDELMSIFDMI